MLAVWTFVTCVDIIVNQRPSSHKPCGLAVENFTSTNKVSSNKETEVFSMSSPFLFAFTGTCGWEHWGAFSHSVLLLHYFMTITQYFLSPSILWQTKAIIRPGYLYTVRSGGQDVIYGCFLLFAY